MNPRLTYISDVLDMDMDEIRVRSDPYAGVFFSKDRVETIIETVDAEESFIVPTSEGSTAFAQGQGKIEVKVLGSGEWMSGCPEGSEFGIRVDRCILNRVELTDRRAELFVSTIQQAIFRRRCLSLGVWTCFQADQEGFLCHFR